MKLTEIKKLKVPELRVKLKELGLDTKGLKAELVGRLWSAVEAGLNPAQQQQQPRESGGSEDPPDGETVVVDSSSTEDKKIEVKLLNNNCPPTTVMPMDVATSSPDDRQDPSDEKTTPMPMDDVASSLDHQEPHHVHDVIVTSNATSDPEQDVVPPPPRQRLNFTRAFTDTATQTEPDTDRSGQQQLLAGVSTMMMCMSKPQESQAAGKETELPAAECQTSDSTRVHNIQEQHADHPRTTPPEEPLVFSSVRADSSHHIRGPLSQPEGGESEEGRVNHHRDTGEEGGRPLLVEEEICKGRAFYEFKEEIRYKRAKSPQPPPERADVDEEEKVKLDRHTCDLHFEVGPDGACGQPRFWDRFPLLWSGCRLSHGAGRGQVGFEVRLDRKLLVAGPEEHESCRDPRPFGLRVGWSVAESPLLLGEEDLSYAYDSQGKKVSDGKEEVFGEPFLEGDVIGCYASFSKEGSVTLSYHKNGRAMGVAFQLESTVLLGRALFPHVLCKGCSVSFHLDSATPSWYPGPPGYTSLTSLPTEDRLRSPRPPSSLGQCEVVMLVGLPGSGKTHWAKDYIKQQPGKHFKLLGTEAIVACMISGGNRESQLQQASQCVTETIKMAAHTPGNYILDQTNVLFSARRHKLQLFSGFRRRVVVVFPAAEEWKRRLEQHQRREGQEIPETALLKLQASCSLPEQEGELLEELQYVELPRDQAQALLQRYKEEARSMLPPIARREKKKPRHRQNRPIPYCPPPTHKSQWNATHGWDATRLNQQSWVLQPRYSNLAYPDRSCYYNIATNYNSSGGNYQGYNTYQGYW